jgi:hypothetical protein
MDEISKADYYDARKDARWVKFNKAHGFYYSRGQVRLVYATQSGKFYCGKFPSTTYEGHLDTYEYLGVIIKQPVCVYKRPTDTKTVIAKAAETV